VTNEEPSRQDDFKGIPADRDSWIEMVCSNFVQAGPKKEIYYRLILEALWPVGRTLPGPTVKLSVLRKIIDDHRGETYTDLARRIRELQGEEGIYGLERYGSGRGTSYQLLHTTLGPKRSRRKGLPPELWKEVLERYNSRCANCGRSGSAMRLDQDHKIPRLRGGGDRLQNWQPLCKECNNFKSTACRDCDLDCLKCPWAFPERYAQVKLTEQNIERIRQQSLLLNQEPSSVLNRIIDHHFDDKAD
jgi:hypothetical protein